MVQDSKAHADRALVPSPEALPRPSLRLVVGPMPEPADHGASGFRFLALFLTLLGGASLLQAVLVSPRVLSRFSADGDIQADTMFRILVIHNVHLMAAAALLVLALLARLAGQRSRLSRKAAGAVIATVLGLYLFGSLELGLALEFNAQYGSFLPFDANRPLAVPDPYHGYLLTPGLGAPYHINSRGFRGDEVGPKVAGELRIVTLGDSITFGLGMSEEVLWQAHLTELLRSRFPGRRISVVNAGTPGYTSLQCLRLLERKVFPLSPDLVIACMGWNDINLSYQPGWSEGMVTAGAHVVRGSGRFEPAILRAIRSVKQQAPESLSITPVPGQGSHPEARVTYRRTLEEVLDLLSAHHVPVLFLNLPTVVSLKAMTPAEKAQAAFYRGEATTIREFQETLDQVMAARKVPHVADLFSLDQTGKAAYFYDHCHFSAKGHQRAAERLFAALETPPFASL